MKTLEFRVISQEEVDHFERTAHDPPAYTDAFTQEDFSREWWGVRDALNERLELFGDEWHLGTDSGDYMVADSRGESRWIYVTFVSTRLWRVEFVYAVADLLASIPQDYRIGCVTELNDKEMLDNPLVYLVISATAALGRAEAMRQDDGGAFVAVECNDALSRFGF